MPYPLGHGGTGIKCHDERKNRTISISPIRISQQLLQKCPYITCMNDRPAIVDTLLNRASLRVTYAAYCFISW